MSPTRTLAVARRVLLQVRRDHRTLVLLLAVPSALMALLRWVFLDDPGTFDRVGPGLLAVFPFTVMFLVTSVTMLRERTSGSLERLMTMPLARLDLLAGYGLAFGGLAAAQAAVAVVLSTGVLGLSTEGSGLALVGVGVLDAVLGTALGLLASAFARTEFQAVQFMPAVVLPQLLVCGLLLPRERLPRPLELVSDALPLSYAVDAVGGLVHGDAGSGVLGDVVVVAAVTVAALGLASLSLSRRTP